MHLPREVRERLVSHLPPKLKKQVQEHLTYPEDSVGRLMNTQFMALRKNLKVQEVIERIRDLAQKRYPPPERGESQSFRCPTPLRSGVRRKDKQGEESTLHRTTSMAPHPHPLPAGEGAASPVEDTGSDGTPFSVRKTILPLPPGESRGEGPRQNDNMWSFFSGKEQGQEQEQEQE